MVSEIKAPRQIRQAILREEYFEITGDFVVAMVLNQMVYWSERSRDADKFVLEEQQRLKENGIVESVELRNGWVWKSGQQLREEMMNFASLTKISRALRELVTMGYLDERRNPNPKYKFDKTKQYRVNLWKLELDLFKKGYSIPNYRFSFDLSQMSEEFIKNLEESLANVPVEKNFSNKSGPNPQDDRLVSQTNRIVSHANRLSSGTNGLVPQTNRTSKFTQTIPENTTKTTTKIKSTKTKPTTDDEDDLSNQKEQKIEAIVDQIKNRLAFPEPNPAQLKFIDNWVAVYDFGSIMNGIERAAEHGGKTYGYIQKAIKTESDELETKIRERQTIPLRE